MCPSVYLCPNEDSWTHKKCQEAVKSSAEVENEKSKIHWWLTIYKSFETSYRPSLSWWFTDISYWSKAHFLAKAFGIYHNTQ